jgi:hypothetical protein
MFADTSDRPVLSLVIGTQDARQAFSLSKLLSKGAGGSR